MNNKDYFDDKSVLMFQEEGNLLRVYFHKKIKAISEGNYLSTRTILKMLIDKGSIKNKNIFIDKNIFSETILLGECLKTIDAIKNEHCGEVPFSLTKQAFQQICKISKLIRAQQTSDVRKKDVVLCGSNSDCPFKSFV